MHRYLLFWLVCFIATYECSAQNVSAPKPLYDDPVFHGAADPVIIYNKQVKKWWMFYTNRRASINDSTVQWVHGTRIGIAESDDGLNWKYIDTADIRFSPDEGFTHWAPGTELTAESKYISLRQIIAFALLVQHLPTTRMVKHP